MSMTREEAIEALQKFVNGYEKNICGEAVRQNGFVQAIKVVISALRPVSREQVEKMRGEWTTDGVCSRCGFDAMYYKGVPVQVRTNYCPTCGSPMTDEAVDMVMERLEALHSETKTD